MPARKISDEDFLNRIARVFQDYGFEGTTLARLSQATGLEKASLYHRFPRGKNQMAEAVLAHVGRLFLEEYLKPLQGPGPLAKRIRESGRRLAKFYEHGQRFCLLQTLSLSGGSPELRSTVANVYAAWRDAFAAAAREAGLSPAVARIRAEEAIIGIHGTLVLSRATDDTGPFVRAIARLPELLTHTETSTNRKDPS